MDPFKINVYLETKNSGLGLLKWIPTNNKI